MIDRSRRPNSTTLKINLLIREDNLYPRGKKIFKVSRFIIYLLSVLIIAFVVFSYQVLFTNNSITDVFSGKVNIFKQLRSLAGDGSRLDGESDNQVNILLLGMGGAGHEGPYLTDTIILASLKPSTGQVAMVSLPRDLLTEIPGFGWWKINNANAFGEQHNSGSGGSLTKEVVQNIFNVPIHYYIRVDFSGFEKVIDDLDGLKINVEKSFIDFQYPTDDFKYQVVNFDQGWQTMDGETALKYARSRHGNNGEGSDFARSKRQQKILSALKERILSYDFLLSPRKINKILQEFATHLRTDLEPWEAIRLAKLFEKVDTSNVITKVLEDSPNGLLYASLVNEAYVLQPRSGDWEQVRYLFNNIFQKEAVVAEKKDVAVEIKNGTTINGLASKSSQELKLLGYRVLQIGNAPTQAYSKTEIYKMNGRDLTSAQEFLEKKYQTKIIDNNIPDWIKNNAALELDFFIVLGADAEIPTE